MAALVLSLSMFIMNLMVVDFPRSRLVLYVIVHDGTPAYHCTIERMQLVNFMNKRMNRSQTVIYLRRTAAVVIGHRSILRHRPLHVHMAGLEWGLPR